MINEKLEKALHPIAISPRFKKADETGRSPSVDEARECA